jgi:hypothetical protein
MPTAVVESGLPTAMLDASPRLSRSKGRQENQVIFPESSKPFPSSPVSELASGEALTVQQLSEPLLRYLGPRSGWQLDPANVLLAMLLGGSIARKPPKSGACGLNSNDMPLQLCVSARRDAAVMVLISDPWADLEDPRLRQRESIACAWRLLTHARCEVLAPRLQSTLATMLPASMAAQGARRMGVLWLGADVRKPAFSVYACPSWDGDIGAGWQRVERWLDKVLPDQGPARRILETVRSVASPECACIEGIAPSSGCAKVYFRLLSAVAPNALRILRLDQIEVVTFLENAVGRHALRLRAMVFGVSFRLDTGAFADAKLDLCGHCLPRPREAWQSVLRRAGELLDIDTTDAVAMLAEEGIELACIGIGRDRIGAFRLNTYGRPVRPTTAELSDAGKGAGASEP